MTSASSQTPAPAAAEPTRRDFLYLATAAVGGIGAAATAWPLVGQMNPTRRPRPPPARSTSTSASSSPASRSSCCGVRARCSSSTGRSRRSTPCATPPFWRSSPTPIRPRASSPPTLPTGAARSGRSFSSWSESAPISAASRSSFRSRARPTRRRTGPAAISAPATARNTTSPEESSSASRRPITCPSRPTISPTTRLCASARTRQTLRRLATNRLSR